MKAQRSNVGTAGGDASCAMELPHPRVARYVDAVIRWRWLIVLGTIAVTVPLAVIASQRLGNQDNALHVWFLPDDPQYQLYQRINHEFESDRMAIVAFRVPDVFQPDVLELIRTITSEMEAIPGLARVVSLTNVTHYESRGDEIMVGALVPVTPRDPVSLAALRGETLHNALYPGSIISPDGTTTAIIGRLGPEDDTFSKARIVTRIRQILERVKRPDVTFYVSGFPVVEYEYSEIAQNDQNRLLPLTFAFVIGALYLSFRRLGSASIATVIQFIVFFVVVGGYLALSNTMNLVMGMIAPILTAACIATSMYVITFYNRALVRGASPRDALVHGVSAVWRPCLFTTLTTAAGFMAFSVSDLAPIRALGRYAAAGVAVEYFVNLTFLPAILSMRRETSPPVLSTVGGGRRTLAVLEWIGRASLGHARAIVALSLVCVVLSIVGIARIRVRSNNIEHISPDTPTRRTIGFIEDHLTKVSSFELILRGNPGMAYDADVLRRVGAFQGELARNQTLGRSFSPLDYLKEVKRVFIPHASELLPETREEAAQLMLLAESSGDREIRRFVNADLSDLRVNVRVPFTGSTELTALLTSVEADAKRLLPADSTIEITGNPILWRTIDDNILRNQLLGFSVAFSIIMLTLTVCLRSWRVAAIAVVPNVIPIGVTLGLMGFVGIPLDPATAMFASLGIAVAVDDTIQFASRLRLELLEDGDYSAAIMRTFASVGGPMVFSSLVMIAGFGILCVGEFLPMFRFGLLISCALIVSLFGDLFLLPALFVLIPPWREVARNVEASRVEAAVAT